MAIEPVAGDPGGDRGAREDGTRWKNEIRAPSEPPQDLGDREGGN